MLEPNVKCCKLFIFQGVLVTEVDDGQKCMHCETCPGFKAHIWR